MNDKVQQMETIERYSERSTQGRRLEQQEEVIDASKYIAIVAEGKWWILSILLLTMSLAGVYMFVTPPSYSADALVRVAKGRALLDEALLDDLLRPAQTPLTDTARPQAEVDVLRSRSILGKVVNDLQLDLQVSPVYLPLIGSSIARWHEGNGDLAPPLLGLRQYAWGGEEMKITRFSVPDTYLDKTFTVVAQAGGRYRVLSPEDKFLEEGRVGTPLQADLGAGQSLSLLIAELKAREGTSFEVSRQSELTAIAALTRKLTIKETGKESGIVSIELRGHDPLQVTHAVNDIVDTYVQQNVRWASAEAEQKLRFLENRLPSVKDRLERSEDSLSAYRQANRATDFSIETDVLLKQLADYETQLMQLRQRRDELRQKFTARHPLVVGLDAQIARQQRALSNLNDRVKRLPPTQQEMLRLSRDVQVNTALYTSLLNSAQEQQVARAGTIGYVRVVDYAVTPKIPVWPAPSLVIAISAVLGVFSGLATVLMRKSLCRRVEDPDLIERHLGLPVYAAIPHSKHQKRLAWSSNGSNGRQPAVLASLYPNDISVEVLRGLRTTLCATRLSTDNGALMVCSPSRGMGKSFIAINLATVLASAKKRVLIVDADLRNGRLHEAFGLSKEPGLSDLASGHAVTEEAIVRTEIAGMDFLPSGRIVANPSELLMEQRIEDAFAKLRECYDHVIIDSPPVLGVSDAAMIGRFASAAILVLKDGTHMLQEIGLSVKRLQQAGVNPCGFLINDIRSSKSAYPY
jgi:tyrosine-protein kinase Etk/Wzc